MPTTPKIPKDRILEAALRILVRDGYSAVTIKTIAKELHCSTQPISWHFRNMEGLRTALGEYAFFYADQKTTPTSSDALEAFCQVGQGMADLAFNEPNLYRFLFLEGSSGYCIGGIDALTELKDNQELIQLIAAQNQLSYDFSAAYLENMIIYTIGLLGLCVSGVIKCNREQACQKIQAAGDLFLSQGNK